MQRSMQPTRDITINLLDEEDEDVATQTFGNNQPARHITIHLGSKGAEGDEEMPGGQEKRRRSQNRDEAYCSVASASSLINTTNYYVDVDVRCPVLVPLLPCPPERVLVGGR